MLKKICKISNKIDFQFVNYLNNNLTKGMGYKDIHYPKWYYSNIDNCELTAPELLRNSWIKYIITFYWIERLDKDGFINN